jgi:hypothetical protein
MKRAKKEITERQTKAAELAAMYNTVAGGGEIEFRYQSGWRTSIGPNLDSDLSLYRVIAAPSHPPIKKKKAIPAKKKP